MSTDEDRTRTLVRDGGSLKLRSPKIRVEVVTGPDAGRVIERFGPEIRVGSATTCEIVLSDPTISRHHLSFRVDAQGVRVIDADSRNGTTIDGLRIRDAYARADSRIKLGSTEMRLRLLEDMIDIPVSQRDTFGGLLGRSTAMRTIFAILERVAPTDNTVLVEGETGTGKELVAEAIHEASERAAGPFIVFDCSAVSGNLLESELFGHVRGAFTGAVADRVGAFEAAHGGTLFVDEIGELPLDLQPKLLRALERREVRRVGENQARRIDVRIVAATNRSLLTEVERGGFRDDLYYRLDVVRIALPPLRERPDDIAALARHFAAELTRGEPAEPGLPDSLIQRFQAQAWPGNVRELRNAVARALSVGTRAPGGSAVPAEAGAIPAAPVDMTVPLKVARDRVVEQFERTYLAAALAEAGGNVTRAAAIAGVHRRFIYRAIHRYKLRHDPP